MNKNYLNLYNAVNLCIPDVKKNPAFYNLKSFLSFFF